MAPHSGRAGDLAALGVELVVGDLHDFPSVANAVRGVRTVFSVQMPTLSATGADFDGEVAQAENLITAARQSGVEHFVQTTVTGAGQHVDAPEWEPGRWAVEPSLTAKTVVQESIRAAGFPRWTILKPGFFMENFLPSAQFMFPNGIDGGLVSILKPATHLSLVAVDDIGAAAAAAITDPKRFDGVELELASDHLSMAQIAEVLSRALERTITAPDMTGEQALAAGMGHYGLAHEWLNVHGQPARPEYAAALSIPLTGFDEWSRTRLLATLPAP